MIGYFVSFLKNELSGDESYAKDIKKYLITRMSPQILYTMSELFQEIFNESINHKFSVKTKYDLKNTLNGIFELVSEKIQRGGESFLEISFLCGGLITLIELDDKILANREKMEVILIDLLSTLGLNLCWSDFNKIITELTSGSIQLRRESRDQLFSLICGNQKNHKQISEIQNFCELYSFQQNTAFA